MKKLKLQLDDLRIDSFATTPVAKAKGTVFGEECPSEDPCLATVDVSCDGACEATAYGTCGELTCEDSCYQCTCVASCGGQTCGWTCRGWYTYGGDGPVQVCAICD